MVYCRFPGKAYLIIFVISTLIACTCDSGDFVPKPRGYYRISFPEKNYRLFDSVCPYTFEYPVYAVVKPDNDERAEPYWINLDFPGFNGTLYISYKKVNHNLYQYFEDARSFVTKHIPKADDITTQELSNDSTKVWGIKYKIAGSGVASALQFSVTDSSQHYLRGALYFNESPNNDSLSPVLDFIEKDIDHLISTLRWKNPG